MSQNTDFDPTFYDPKQNRKTDTVKPAGRLDTDTVKPAGRLDEPAPGGQTDEVPTPAGARRG